MTPSGTHHHPHVTRYPTPQSLCLFLYQLPQHHPCSPRSDSVFFGFSHLKHTNALAHYQLLLSITSPNFCALTAPSLLGVAESMFSQEAFLDKSTECKDNDGHTKGKRDRKGPKYGGKRGSQEARQEECVSIYGLSCLQS